MSVMTRNNEGLLTGVGHSKVIWSRVVQLVLCE